MQRFLDRSAKIIIIFPIEPVDRKTKSWILKAKDQMTILNCVLLNILKRMDIRELWKIFLIGRISLDADVKNKRNTIFFVIAGIRVNTSELPNSIHTNQHAAYTRVKRLNLKYYKGSSYYLLKEFIYIYILLLLNTGSLQ